MVFLIGLLTTTQAQQKVELVGTCKLTQAGSCKIASDPFNVKIILMIDTNTSKITGEEFKIDENNRYEKMEFITWTGEVLNSSAIRLQQVRQLTCSDGKRTETLHFIGVIDNSKMKIIDRFAMCPNANCLFDIEYDLKVEIK